MYVEHWLVLSDVFKVDFSEGKTASRKTARASGKTQERADRRSARQKKLR